MINETYLKVITLLLFTVSPMFAQEITQLTGRVSAPNLEEASIHIINSTQETGTVNSNSGSFMIKVRENDELLFSSVQYKNVSVIVTSEIIRKGILNVVLEEDLNVLDEVNISNVNLTGNINTDISQIQIVRDMPVNIKYRDIKNIIFEADINDPQKAPRNLAFESNEIMDPAVNLMSIPVVLEELYNKKEREFLALIALSKSSSNELRQLFQEDFFIITLKLKKDYIDDFIYYVIDHGLNEVLKKSDKLALMEFLIDKSEKYNSKIVENH